MDCDICCETINGNNKRVTCGFCEASSCAKCTERYLLEIHDDPHCMHCRKAWDRDVLAGLLTRTFLNTKYKKYRKATLIDREKSLLPQTQPDVDAELANREREKVRRQLNAEKTELIRRLNDIRNAVVDLDHGGEVQKIEGAGGTTTRKCPVENCRGFLNRTWSCGICETRTCRDCNEPMKDDHVCDPNDVETMNLLRKDSKPCPCCGTMITKIDGCDQMWCTLPSCHTAFSWRTGKKVFGVIHNPHFIQFAAANGTAERNPQDIPCGGLPDIYAFFNRVQTFDTRSRDRRATDGHKALAAAITAVLPRVIHGIRHLIHVEEAHYSDTNVRDRNTDLRVRYLLNEMDDKAFANAVMRREVECQKRRAFHDIVVMTMHTGSDIVISLFDLLHRDYDLPQIEAQTQVVEKLREYANEQFARVGKLHACKYPALTEQWEFMRYSPGLHIKKGAN